MKCWANLVRGFSADAPSRRKPAFPDEEEGDNVKDDDSENGEDASRFAFRKPDVKEGVSNHRDWEPLAVTSPSGSRPNCTQGMSLGALPQKQEKSALARNHALHPSRQTEGSNSQNQRAVGRTLGKQRRLSGSPTRTVKLSSARVRMPASHGMPLALTTLADAVAAQAMRAGPCGNVGLVWNGFLALTHSLSRQSYCNLTAFSYRHTMQQT